MTTNENPQRSPPPSPPSQTPEEAKREYAEKLAYERASDPRSPRRAGAGVGVGALPGKPGALPRNASRQSTGGSGVSTSTTGTAKAAVQEEMEWVQCEKCEKWRKLPPNLSAADLPDKWFCAMNTWDKSSASCHVEENLDENEIKGEFTILSGASAAAGKLSYRNLMFGSQGTNGGRPFSEKARALDSVFSTSNPITHEPEPVYLRSTMYVGGGQKHGGGKAKEEQVRMGRGGYPTAAATIKSWRRRYLNISTNATLSATRLFRRRGLPSCPFSTRARSPRPCTTTAVGPSRSSRPLPSSPTQGDREVQGISQGGGGEEGEGGEGENRQKVKASLSSWLPFGRRFARHAILAPTNAIPCSSQRQKKER